MLANNIRARGDNTLIVYKDNYINELRLKNIDALNYIVDTYSNILFKVAYSVLNNREYSEECINDVFMEIWSNIDKFRSDEEKFKNWICTIAKYTAIDMLRKIKKHDNNLSIDDKIEYKGDSIERNFENSNDLLIIRNEINSMNTRDKEIFIRRFYYGEKIKEISKSLGISENAVNIRILRGRKMLSERLEKGGV